MNLFLTEKSARKTRQSLLLDFGLKGVMRYRMSNGKKGTTHKEGYTCCCACAKDNIMSEHDTKILNDLRSIVDDLKSIREKLRGMRAVYFDKRIHANQHISMAYMHHSRLTVDELNSAIKILTPKE